MRDPDRLLHDGANEVERALLEAAWSEEPPAHGPERLRAALGLSAAVAAVTLASAGSASAVAPVAAAAGASKLASAKLLAWLLLAGGALGVGTVVLVATPARTPRAVHVVAPTRPPLAAKAPPPSAEAQAPEAPASEPRVEAAPVRPLRSIRVETARLDRARAALQRDDAPGALRALEGYRRAHPRGVLRQEADVLRIEALVRAGDGQAARRAARFLREHPDSPHAERVRALVAAP